MPSAAAMRTWRLGPSRSGLGLAHATVLRMHLLEVEIAAIAGQLPQAATRWRRSTDSSTRRRPAGPTPIRRRAWRHLAACPRRGRSRPSRNSRPRSPTRSRCRRTSVELLLALAAAQRRDRRYRDARRPPNAPRAIFAALGMPPFVAMAERELAPHPGSACSAVTSDLTPAEARIAGLVAEGRSNKEVAAELVLSVKTVEVTLTRVYEKLGVRSRAELAAHFRPSRRLTPPVPRRWRRSRRSRDTSVSGRAPASRPTVGS